MIKISSLTIAKNEELNIERCIKSQLSCIDNIYIFVDNKTSDNTIEIIKKYPNVNYQVIKWKGYSETKKEALNTINGKWIFWIDADEEITDELSEELIKFKKNNPEFIAYSVSRRAYFLNKWIKHCGWYPNRVVRLFNKDIVSFNNNLVHEGLTVNGEIGMLKNDLNHYTDPNIKHYYLKFNHYTTLAAEELFNKKKKVKIIDLLIRPFAIFFKMYFLKQGFLDGIHGLILCGLSANYVFTKYAKLWELFNKKHEST